jgi:hypothetical protein
MTEDRQFAGKDALKWLAAGIVLTVAAAGPGCTPTVKVEAPDKPIVINLNVKIEQEVRVKIERELEDSFEENPDLFN